MIESPPGQVSTSRRFGMIADDLTGACDAGVEFAQRGFSTWVCLSADQLERKAFDLAVLSTRSRDDAPPEAATKVREACHALRGQHREVIYKKMDSTLRGNVGWELDAAMEACDFTLGLVAPAFPALGRTLEAGMLVVKGSHRSETIHVPNLLRQQSRHRIEHLDRNSWASGPDGLRALLETYGGDQTLVVLDSKTEADLETIARAATQLPYRVLLAGSAGLAAAAAKTLAEKVGCSASRIVPPIAPRKTPGSVILVMGSSNQVTRAQIECLMRNERVALVENLRDVKSQILSALESGRHVLLIPKCRPEAEGDFREYLNVFESPAVCGLVVSGGDTAFALSRALGATGIELEREVLPGIPLGRLVGGVADGLAVVTKAGGFGGVDALASVAEFLSQGASAA